MSTPLRPGVHAWVYPLPRFRDFREMCEGAQRFGFAGLIVQAGLSAGDWVQGRKNTSEGDTRGLAGRMAKDHGLQLTAGYGLDGSATQGGSPELAANAILTGLRAAGSVMLDWEGRWDLPGSQAQADAIADLVLAAEPSADRRIVDCPWWAPLSIRRGKGRTSPTHPRAPHVQFGRLAKTRYVQAYGANLPGSPDGASLSMLSWARSPTQYASLGIAREHVLGSFQGYERSVTDCVRTLLAEPNQCVWLLNKLSLEFRVAMEFVRAIAREGFSGPGADVAFQVARSIPGPQWLGPLALRAAGVSVSTSARLRYRSAP